MTFLMAGGGTGGHVIPAIAVARHLRSHGHEVFFVGTERGAEARLVPAAGFRLEKIQVGGMKNLGALTKLVSLWRLIAETLGQFSRIAKWKPAAVFSMGGYVAGPPVLAALMRGVPVVVMEPNAVPGVTNRWISRWVARALISFGETSKFFPPKRTELTGLPVREEFFRIASRPARPELTILITGGSQGSRTLNDAARNSWSMFIESGLPVRLIHQTGKPQFSDLDTAFRATSLDGEISAFIEDMPAAFAAADLIVCRAGAGTVSELAASGKPSILIPFPFAADDHQLKNAQALERGGAAIVSLDREWTAPKFFEIVKELYGDRSRLTTMSEAARKLARQGAAERAAEILIEEALTDASLRRNNN